MEFNQLHFAYPAWFWAALIIPLVGILLYFFYHRYLPENRLERFIDKHLLPYLIVSAAGKKRVIGKNFCLWSVTWLCLITALAGPRWSFREIETYSSDQNLVILLDLSESMNATDIKPSRLARAKQKIEDLLNEAKGVKIGLLAFAADPHMITPLTDDTKTIRHFLETLETDLVSVQGSRLTSALDMASTMLEAEPGSNKALLIISDGGFEDSSAIVTAKKMAQKGIVIHVMGMGTTEGAPLYSKTKGAAPAFSKLEKERLVEISKAAQGRYLEAHYSEESIVLQELQKHSDLITNSVKKNQLWDEHFYLIILPILPIFLWWFRRGYIFLLPIIFMTQPYSLEASTLAEYFKNSEELGLQAFENENYGHAADTFQDYYRKGVCYYKAKNYAEAETMFKLSDREEVACSAAYNIGNCLAYQEKFKEAMATYEEVLKKWPEHKQSKENLEILKKMMEQNQDNSKSNPENSDQNKSDNEKESENQDNNNQDSQGQDKNNDKSCDESKDQCKQNQSDEPSQQDKQDPQDQNERKDEQDQDKADNRQDDLDKSNQDEQQKQKEAESEKPQEAIPESPNEKDPANQSQLKSQEEQEAEFWLNRLENDSKTFMKNKFYIESKRNGTKEGIDPW